MMYNADGWWVGPVLFSFTASFVLGLVVGSNSGEDTGRNKGIIYCMEQPAKCKVEYQYLKLTEKTK